ncbi:MAG: MBG domain-containing protein, partial [Acidobacteriaceae bacterium]
MNVNFVCQNAHSSASCLSSFRYKANKLTMPVLALLALLCGMTASAHAQIASYAGVTTPFPTGVTLTNVEGMGTDSIAGGNGNVFFAGYNGTTWGVYEMTRSTTTPATYGTATLLTSPTATYSYLRGVAIDKNGNLWFADNGNGTAGTSQLYWMQYNSTTKAFAAPQTVGTGWVALWGIATDTAGNVFVTDNGAATAPANSLFEVSAASIALAAPAATLIPNTTVTSPRGIAVDGSDDIFVIDGAYQVEGLTSATTYATATVINNTGFQGPGDLALDANGNLWLSEYSTNSARELTVGSGYATVYSWGSTTTINGPVAVWPDADGNILISDVNDGAINQINTQPPTFTTAVALGGSSSAPQTLTFSFPGSTTTTIGAPVIVGPDFVNAGTGTCTAAGSPYATLATCTVAVNFTPLSPGPRWGAVELVDGSGNVLAQELIYGSATGPEITYPSSGATALDSGHAFSSPQQIAVDAAGDVFIVENGSSAVSVIKGGVTSQPINGLNNPFGIAVDGAGNIFVAQAGSGKIAEFYAPLYATSRTLGASLDTPLGMAFDGSGNLYVTEAGGTNDVVKLSAVTDYGNRTVLSSSFTTPFAVAVDGSGNVWVADKGATSVTELSPAGAVTGTFGSFSSPEGIAVDPAGNVYVSDNGGSSISELTKATNFATTVTLASSTSTPAVATPVGVALDSHGNVYYANGDGTVDEINLTTAPTLAFGNEPYGTLSAPQSVILSNIGNADLNFTNIQTTTDYVNVGTGGDCVVGTPVTAGGSCPLAITFTPTSIGSDPGTATLTDVAIPNPQVISLSGSGTQATPTLSVTNSPVTYNGAPQAATVTGSVAGTVSNVLYNGSATVPTTAGTYPITANFTPSNPADYATLTAASAGSFVISKATPTLSITNTPAPYTGNPVAATVVGSVGGTVSAVLYGGSATVPTAAGTYAVTASFTPSDTTDYNSLTAASAGNFVIGKVTPTLSISNSPVTYTGAAQAATVTGSVGGSVSNVLYNGSATFPITAGTYAVTANFTPTDTADYNTLTAASAGNFVINKATLTLSITNSPATYTGAGQSATIVATATGITGTVAGTPGAVLYNGSATLPVAAGTYPVTANFAPTDVNDFNTVTAGSAGNFVIGKATPTLSVTNSPVTYNGNPQSATVTGSVGGTVSSVLYNG